MSWLPRWWAPLRRAFLWRVRSRLLLSYVLIGLVPAFLLVVFFAVAGLLLFFNAGTYMLRGQIASVAERARSEALASSLELQAAFTAADLERVLARRRVVASQVLPAAIVSVADGGGRCGAVASVMAAPPVSSVPSWIVCEEGFSGLVDARAVDVAGVATAATPATTTAASVTGIAIRAVSWVPGQSRAVVVDVPLDGALASYLADATGVSMVSVARFAELADGADAAASPSQGGAARRAQAPAGPPQIVPQRDGFVDVGRSLRWASFLESTAWSTGRRRVIFTELGVDFMHVYRRLVSTPTPPFATLSVSDILLILLGVIAALFLLIQLVASAMGIALARSITGAVHALFQGTEQVRRGDFSHKIDVTSDDQLGALASSFNTMTTSIEDLLIEKAKKERLEQELTIARGIQMSLLPQGPLAGDGVLFAGHCEPARAVGGDYFDFWAIDDDRFGMLIADVAGKGTSAALYMAELKGIVLSLSQSHTSPRQLLIDANRIVSRHLDARSFITMTYGVVDVRARSLTYARAGHCPLIRLPAPGSGHGEPELLSPGGLVLGLKIDDDGLFERLLEESTVPLRTGDVFMLYTDGVTEAMSPEGDFFGEERLTALAQDHGRDAFPVLRQRVLDAVSAFAGAVEQQDDMTMLVLQVHERSAAA